MSSVEPVRHKEETSCVRSYGRAIVALQSSFETPHGNVPCSVLDLSLGGARVATDQTVEAGASIWLSLHKLKVFGTVSWARDNLIGIQFEENLPKAIVLSLRGESVDPEELERVEAMMAAQKWVIGTPTDRPRSMRLADVLGSRNAGPVASIQSGVFEAQPSVRGEGFADRRGIDRRALLVMVFAAMTGVLIGIGSVLAF